MNFRLDQTSKDRIEATNDLGGQVSAICAEVHTGADGEEELQILVNLSSTVTTTTPNSDTGRILNSIASTVRERAADLPISTVVTFSSDNDV